MRKSGLIMILMAMTALISGCGEGSDAETAPPSEAREFHITVDGKPRPENAGVIVAYAHGHFSDVGLDVILHYPVTPMRPVQYVANGSVDVAVSHPPEVLLAQERGVPIVAVASVIPEPTAAMIWLPGAKIDGIADLKGKTIATPGLHFQKVLLENFLAQAGLGLADVKVDPVEYDLVPALVSGRADAIFGGSWSVEGVELEERGLDPVITRIQDFGVPSYEELVLIARRDRLSRDPQSIRDFISAMDRGTAEVIEDPEAAAEVVAYRRGELPDKVIKAQFEATVPLLSESGQMNDEQAGQLVEWMYGEGLIERKPPASALFTNEYLPES